MKKMKLLLFMLLSTSAFCQWPSLTAGPGDGPCAQSYFGRIYDDGGPFGNYTPSMYRRAVIHASRPDYCVELYLDTIDIDDLNGDYILLADGLTPLIGQVIYPGCYDSRCDSFSVGLRSLSGSVGGTGFSGRWYCVPQAYYLYGNYSVTRQSGILYDEGGQTGNYPLGSHGQFTINAPNAGDAVVANFNYFSLTTDSFFIYDGTSTSAPILWQGGFFNSPGYIMAPSGHMTVRFKANSTGIVARGWRMVWNCVGASAFTQNNSSVTSDNGILLDEGGLNGNYGNNDSIVTTIYPATPGSMLDLRVYKFSTERTYDYLSIYDGPNTSYPLIGSYTGDTIIARNFLSSHSALTLKFISDGSTTANGFVLGWVAHAPPSSCVVNGISELESSGISIYPNPVTDVLRVQNVLPYETITLSDFLGKTLISDKADEHGYKELSILHLSSGIYFVNGFKFIKY